jgi:hypothetical protein
MIIALFAVSCKSNTTTSRGAQKEIGLFTERLTGTLATIPVERVPLIIQISSLHNVPPGARFVAKSGRATAELEVKGDTLIVTATCDSLQQLIYTYEAELQNYQEAEQQTITKAEYNPFSIKSFIYGLMAGVLIIFFIKLILYVKNKW